MTSVNGLVTVVVIVLLVLFVFVFLVLLVFSCYFCFSCFLYFLYFLFLFFLDLVLLVLIIVFVWVNSQNVEIISAILQSDCLCVYYYYCYNHFTALWTLSRTTRVSQYQKKHSLTHTYYGHQSSLQIKFSCSGDSPSLVIMQMDT